MELVQLAYSPGVLELELVGMSPALKLRLAAFFPSFVLPGTEASSCTERFGRGWQTPFHGSACEKITRIP
jgi:hypothetical protein